MATVENAREWLNSWRPEAPQRLSDRTHELAAMAISGEHGRSMANAEVSLDEDALAGVGPSTRYGLAAILVAESAPLRILPGELIVGSSTLLEAVRHQVPVANINSVSHTTLGFHRVLPTGYGQLREQVTERIARGDLDEKGQDLLEGMRLCLEAAEIWRLRHIALLDEMIAQTDDPDFFIAACDSLSRVPEGEPESFRDAVQSLWFMFAFQRLMGNWPGIGRVDEMLGPYLERDLADGVITPDEARELIAHLWIKGCEWIGASDFGGSGDAQHYQNVLLGGVNGAGEDITNEVTYLILEVVEELHISDYPIAVRVGSRTPDKLIRKVAEVQRHGGGIVAIYNEDVVIEGLVKFGYELDEARTFTNDGCWEVLIPGRTQFGYLPFDALALLHEVLGMDTDGPAPEYADFEALYAAYVSRLSTHIDWHHELCDEWGNHGHPTPLTSLFVEDCVERGRGYYERGARYNALAPHAGGLANVVNSLLVLKTLVYDDGELTLRDLVEILRGDWDGQESLRRMILNRFAFYGNDHPEADAMMGRVFNDYTDLVWRVTERCGVKRPCGISTFGREIEWSKTEGGGRGASPDGHRRGAVLATNFSPSPGTDREGPTSVVKSYCKQDFTRTPNGATLELKLHPATVKGESGLEAMASLLKTFVELGGFYLQVDVVDSEMLKDAQRHPEKYPNLSVRISGWSARFATLSKDWQDMIIARTQQLL